ncbi:MAG: aldolase/citrate lyase family protein [Cyclobacteriaceae bacterium]
MENEIAISGKLAEKDRSDCQVTLEITDSGGVVIDLVSKVRALYGDSIRELCMDVMQCFSIENAKIQILDRGALTYVISARLEAAVKQLIRTRKEFLLDMRKECQFESSFDQPRISRLYIPGNKPALMINAGVHRPHGIIFDLEDSVAYHRKEEARLLVRNALRSVDLNGAERMVRINQIPMGLEDLDYIVPHNVNLIVVPKCEYAAEVHEVNKRIRQIQSKDVAPIWLMPIIESARGVMNAMEIAESAENVVALAIGLEDYTADLGVSRTKNATESLFARSCIVNACAAAGIQALDSVFSDVGDMEGLVWNAQQSRALGFQGMGVIHPRQIKFIHESYRPGEKEILWAQEIVEAFDKSAEEGVISIGTKMIDMPVVLRARKTLKLAEILY